MSVMTKVLGVLRFGKPELGHVALMDSRLLGILGVVRSLKLSAGRPWASTSEANRFADGLRVGRAIIESQAKLPIAR